MITLDEVTIQFDVISLYNQGLISQQESDKLLKSLDYSFDPMATSRSVHIAAATTAYGRMEIYKYKDEYTAYSNTDCVITTKKLPDKFVQKNTLGALKLEEYVVIGFFISPKCQLIKNEKDLLIKKLKAAKGESLSLEDSKKLFERETLYIPRVKYFTRNSKGFYIYKKVDGMNISGTFQKRIKLINKKTKKWEATAPLTKINGVVQKYLCLDEFIAL